MAKKEPVLVVDSKVLVVLCLLGVGYYGINRFLNAEWGRHK